MRDAAKIQDLADSKAKTRSNGLPYIEMTSQEPWDPRKYDNEIDIEKFMESIPADLHLLPNKDYSMTGQFIDVNKTKLQNPDEPRGKFWVPESKLCAQRAIN